MSRTDLLTLCVGLAGAGAVTYGVGQCFAPAGWVVGGLFGLAWSYLTARGAAGRGGR